jgi:hypothetical protein
MDTGTIVTLGLAAATVISTSGAVMWRLRQLERTSERQTAKLDELVAVVAGQRHIEEGLTSVRKLVDEHQKEDDARYSEIRARFHSQDNMINAHNLEIAVLKQKVGMP